MEFTVINWRTGLLATKRTFDCETAAYEWLAAHIHELDRASYRVKYLA